MKTQDPMSPLPHVNNTRFRQAIKKYFYKDIEPEYTLFIENLIINGSIESLDTLKELAEAIGNDPNFFGDVNARFNEVELVTSAALNDLNSKKQDNLESGVNIKTVNGFSLVGSGDVAISTYRGIPANWDINHTMADLIDSIAADTSAVPGESYMGTVHLSDLPGNMILAELIIEVMDELSGDKTVLFQLSSADTSPYKWEYVSAYGAVGVWRSWVTAATLATVATSGNYDDLSNKPTLPDVSGKEDKVDIVLANGTTLSAEVGKYYRLTNVGTLAITLPTIAVVNSTVQTVSFYINAGPSPAVTFTSSHSIYYSDGFEIAADSTYEVNALYNGAAWIVASIKIVVV